MVNKLIDNKTWNARKVSSNQTEFHVGWVNYLDENDAWQEIDCIVTKTDSDFTVTKAPFNFSAPLYSDGVAFFESDNKFDITNKSKITADNYGLYITARNVTKVAGELFDIDDDGRLDAVIYKQAYPDIDADLIYYVKHGKAPRLEKLVRFNSVLSADTDIEFHLRYTDTPAITPSTLDDSKNRDDEATANRTKLKNGELISQDNGFHIKPFGVSENRGLGMKEIKIWDSVAIDLDAEPTTQKIETVDTDIKTDGSGYSILTKHIKASFFSGVTYPVFTDAVTAFNPDADAESTSVDGETYTWGGSNWDTEHDKTTANARDTTTSSFIGHFKSNIGTNQYSLARMFYLFDTSALGSGEPIQSATFSHYYLSGWVNDAGGGSVASTKSSTVVQSSPASNTALASGDFDQCGSVDNPTEGIDSGDRFDAWDDWTLNQYNDIELNSTGVGWVSDDGITKLGVRVTLDCTDSDPGAGYYINLAGTAYADYSGTDKDPKLTVTHGTTFIPRVIMF